MSKTTAKITATNAAKPRTTRKATVVNETVVEPLAAQEDPSYMDKLFERWSAVNDELLQAFGVPSQKRMLCALVACVVVGGGIGYFGATLLGYMMAGALLFTGSAFLALLIYVLGLCMIIYTSIIAGKHVTAYICSGKIDRHYEVVRDKVSGFFGRARDALSFGSVVEA